MNGYALYSKNNMSVQYLFDKFIGTGGSTKTVDLKPNRQRTQLDTFGRFPLVYYAGKQSYRSFSLSTVFVAETDDNGIVLRSAKQVGDDFAALVTGQNTLIVEGCGEKMLCEVQITSYNVPVLYDEEILDYVEMSITCTEVGVI